jgi:hypothetical protein
MALTDRKVSNFIAYTENGDPLSPIGPVYSASAVNITSAATATDIFTITGSATKNVRIHRVTVTATLGTAAAQNVMLIKRSAANTGGTSATVTNVPLDSSYAAATATVRSYTVNPTGLGAAVGTLRVRRIAMPLATASALDVADFAFSVPVILRGTAQVLSVNLNSGNTGAAVFSAFVEWSED